MLAYVLVGDQFRLLDWERTLALEHHARGIHFNRQMEILVALRLAPDQHAPFDILEAYARYQDDVITTLGKPLGVGPQRHDDQVIELVSLVRRRLECQVIVSAQVHEERLRVQRFDDGTIDGHVREV